MIGVSGVLIPLEVSSVVVASAGWVAWLGMTVPTGAAV